jgi:hypothetical protein
MEGRGDRDSGEKQRQSKRERVVVEKEVRQIGRDVGREEMGRQAQGRTDFEGRIVQRKSKLDYLKKWDSALPVLHRSSAGCPWIRHPETR